uniref:Uncharacterized protein n=1 Tax=Tanacetum cinerariifolium TaxID=118510 RepID=A0A6L2JI81_TANCI|nr:hypothetical protein [Tanacetum cinerariifolium]
MDPNSSLGKICLGENVVEILSDKIEGSGDWDSPEYQYTANSGGKKETKAMVFRRWILKKGNIIVKKELIVALRGEIYFVKLIINPEEDDVEPGVIFGRSFVHITKAITDFRAGTITIYPDIDSFLKDTEEEEKSMDDWDQLLDFNLDGIPLLGGEELLSFVCKIGKCRRNKKRAMENLNLFYQDIGTSSPVLETMAYHDKYKKVLDVIWKDKVELDGMILKEEEEAIKKVKGDALKEKDDPEAFIFPNRMEVQVNKNALANTWSDINTMPYRIYEQLGREEMKKVDRGITMISHTQAEAMGIHINVLCQTMGGNDAKAGSSRSKCSRQFKTVEEILLPQVPYDFLPWKGCNNEAKSREIDDMLRIMLREAESNEEIFTSMAWIRAFNIKEPIYAELCHEFYSTYEFDEVCADDELQSKKIIKFRLGERAYNLTLLKFARRLGLYHAEELENDGFDVYFQGGLRSDDNFNAQEYWNLILRVIHKMITYGLFQRTNGYDKIQKNDLWLLSMFDARHQNGYIDVAWLIARWVKRKGVGTQRDSQICCRQFITKITRKERVLIVVVLRSLSASIYFSYIDTTTLKKLINSEGRLIHEDLQLGVPRVGIPRPQRALMQDLHDRMGSMEIRQEAIERMEYMQSYH